MDFGLFFRWRWSRKLRFVGKRFRDRGDYSPKVRRIFFRAFRLFPFFSSLSDYKDFVRDQGRDVRNGFCGRVLSFYRRHFGATQANYFVGNAEKWYEDFFSTVNAACGRGGVCVIGNSALLLGSGLGSKIDGHDLVVRFNQCFSNEKNFISDTGLRCNIWVGAPNYRGPVPHADAAVISGPDMAERVRNWQPSWMLMERKIPILSVPLPVWRALVRKLHAPPSAGVLMLAWLHRLQGSWHGICYTGIGEGLAPGYRYHAVLPGHLAAARHNWQGEQRLLALWREEGLCRL